MLPKIVFGGGIDFLPADENYKEIPKTDPRWREVLREWMMLDGKKVKMILIVKEDTNGIEAQAQAKEMREEEKI
jgi:hypothetical protein